MLKQDNQGHIQKIKESPNDKAYDDHYRNLKQSERYPTNVSLYLLPAKSPYSFLWVNSLISSNGSQLDFLPCKNFPCTVTLLKCAISCSSTISEDQSLSWAKIFQFRLSRNADHQIVLQQCCSEVVPSSALRTHLQLYLSSATEKAQTKG